MAPMSTIGIGLKRMRTRGLKTKSRWNSLEQSLLKIKTDATTILKLFVSRNSWLELNWKVKLGKWGGSPKMFLSLWLFNLRKCSFYWLLSPTLKSTWLRLISLDKCEGEARVSSRKGKVLLSLKFKVRKYVAEISRCCLCMIGILSLAGRATLSEEVNFKENLRL